MAPYFLKLCKPTISNPAINFLGSFWSGRLPIHLMSPYIGLCVDNTSTTDPIPSSGSALGTGFRTARGKLLLPCDSNSSVLPK